MLAGIGAVIAIPEEVVAVVTIAVVALAVLTVVAIADVAIQEYRNNHIQAAQSSTPTNNQTANPPKNKTKPSGKAKNKLKPDPNAEGDHTTFKWNPDTGKVTNYETWRPNPKNPTGFDSEKRYDGIGDPHLNPVTQEDLMQHQVR